MLLGNAKNRIIIEHIPTTYGIANKGDGDLRSFIPRLHACVGGYERSPQSLTSHTAGTSDCLKTPPICS